MSTEEIETEPYTHSGLVEAIREAERVVQEAITDPVLQVSAFEVVLPLIIEYEYEDLS